jgi:hypothetical protein
MTAVDAVTRALQELEPEILEPLHEGHAASELSRRIHAVRKLLAKQEPRWIGIAEAKRLLGAGSEDAVKARIEWGSFRSRQSSNGYVEVLLDDVLREREVGEGLSAFGGEELTPEELDEMHKAQPGTNPWEREQAEPAL